MNSRATMPILDQRRTVSVTSDAGSKLTVMWRLYSSSRARWHAARFGRQIRLRSRDRRPSASILSGQPNESNDRSDAEAGGEALACLQRAPRNVRPVSALVWEQPAGA
jgi:hypothetical protein